MKNREKFREEIAHEIRIGSTCNFIKNTVMPAFFKADGTCNGVECFACSNMFALWLDEEYAEPPKPKVDWSKVPVDTLVRVRDREEQEWILMYFKGISDCDYDRAHRFMTWCDGATSKTVSGGDYIKWKYCELVEVEDE